MMFLNCQKPGLIKDPYIYKPDSIMLDLEDAVAEREKDAARYSLYHALQEIDYRGVERVVRINGLDTDLWREDVRCAVAGGCDSIRIPKTENADDVRTVEYAIAEAEREFRRPEGSVLIMAALESARGVINAMSICDSSERLFGIALSGGDYSKDLQISISGTGVEFMGARQHMIIAARAAKVQCFDTVWTNLSDMDGFRREVEIIHSMGFDGKSIINPRQIEVVNEIFAPKEKEIEKAKTILAAIKEAEKRGSGVIAVNGKMVDRPVVIRAQRTIDLAIASGILTKEDLA
jgi:citrate lyase subunit beta/citryl-CoA lyase